MILRVLFNNKFCTNDRINTMIHRDSESPPLKVRMGFSIAAENLT